MTRTTVPPGICTAAAALYALIVLLILSAASRAQVAPLELKLYKTNPYDGTTQGDGLTWRGIARMDASLGPGQYYLFPATGTQFISLVKTAALGTAQDIQIGARNVAPGIALASLVTTDGGTVTELGFEPGRAVKRVSGVDTPVTISKTGTRQWKRVDQVSTKPYPAAQTHVHNYIVLVGGSDPCPPRELTFRLNMSFPSSGTYEVNLIVDGASVYGSQYTSGVVGPGNTTFTVPNVATAKGSFVYVWKVNGVVQATGTYSCGQEIPNDTITDAVNSGPAAPLVTNESGTATPIPDYPKPTDPNNGNVPKGGSTTPGPTAPTPGTSGPRPSAGNFTGGGDQEDIYQAVRKALTDSGNEANKPLVNQDEPEDGAAHLDERGKLDELQEKLNQGVYDAHLSKTTFGTKFVEFASVDLPTGLGKATAVNFGTLNFSGKDVELKIEFSDYQATINIIRTVSVWLFGIGWIYHTVFMVRSYM